MFSKFIRVLDLKKQLLGSAKFLEYSILLHLGEGQDKNDPLTIKRLILLDLSSEASVRRALRKLMDEGKVIKEKHNSDMRNYQLKLSDEMLEGFHKHFQEVQSLFEREG